MTKQRVFRESAGEDILTVTQSNASSYKSAIADAQTLTPAFLCCPSKNYNYWLLLSCEHRGPGW